jgi:hypothetical protein
MRLSSILPLTCLLALTILTALVRPAQAADPAVQLQLGHFNRLLRTRVETITILDGEDGASGGLGVTYFKSNTFSGFSWGLDFSFAL